ncbi:elongin-B-like [Antedon mediterranea]|uniref:elongin-B-like n=1 Tax=Antedon mediterranea TaxID=105859 RepID=UPI003AF66D92
MDVFLTVRRKKTTIFLDAKESNTVYDLKQMIEGITKRSPEDQKLFKNNDPLEDTKTLGDCGFTSQNAKAQSPAQVGLAFKTDGEDDFEDLEIIEYSCPPELPDVMKPTDSSTTAEHQSS